MRRVKWGIGAAVVVGLAWVVSNFFNMGGLGTGEGARIGLPVQNPVATPADPPPQDEPETEAVPTESVSAEGEERAIGEGGVVEVLIDDRNYFLRRGTGDDAEWVPAEADAIAGYARQAAGDEAGIRVRLFRKPSARAAAEDELSETLRGVGLKDAEIDVPEKLVE